MKLKRRRKNRKGVAAVEAAVLLPVLVLIWLGSYEATRMVSLKQQAQLLSTNAASQVLSSSTSFENIETDVEDLATSLGINGCEATLTRVDSEVVESRVEIDFSQNSPISSLLAGRKVTSTFLSYRKN